MRFIHRLRAFCDGILVGIGAVLADDLRLTARYGAQRQPQPLVLDTHLRLPPHARILQHARPPWILTGPQPHPQRAQTLCERDGHILPLPLNADHRIDLAAALRLLRQRGIRTLMVEGGPTVHTAFLRAGLGDWLAITIQTEPLPPGQPGQVLVQTLCSAISPGTEMLIYRGEAPQHLAADTTISALEPVMNLLRHFIRLVAPNCAQIRRG